MIAPLRDRRTLHHLRAQGHRGRAGLVTVRYAGPSTDGRLFFAFAIGRRTGSAVVRNRIRRRLKAALVELAASGAVPGGSALVSGRAELATVPFSVVRRDVRRALERAASAPHRPGSAA